LDEGLEAVCTHQNAELHVLHVLSAKEGREDSAELERASAHLEEHVAQRVAAARERGLSVNNRVVTHVAVGKPAVEIVQLGTDLHSDVIMLGTHGRTGVQRLVLGSIAESVVRTAPCPVLVLRDKDFTGGVPEIEPPCARCIEVRRESNGEKLWCTTHSHRLGRRHTYFNRQGPTGRPPYSGGIA
jgi:nucleotide-binding universal stress UspA family protein